MLLANFRFTRSGFSPCFHGIKHKERSHKFQPYETLKKIVTTKNKRKIMLKIKNLMFLWRLPWAPAVSLKRQIIAKQVRSTVRSLHSLYLNFQLGSFLLMKSTKQCGVKSIEWNSNYSKHTSLFRCTCRSSNLCRNMFDFD